MQALEGLCRLLIRLVRFTASIWYLAIFDAFSQTSEAWECDRLSKQPDRDAMEFVLGQTRRRARLFLFYLVLDTSTARFSAALFVLLARSPPLDFVQGRSSHSSVWSSRSASILISSGRPYFEETDRLINSSGSCFGMRISSDQSLPSFRNCSTARTYAMFFDER